MEYNKKIMIACPINDREWVLDYYLDNLLNIDYPKELISFYFIINNSSDRSLDIVKDFRLKYKNEYNHIKIDTCNSKIRFKDNRGVQTRNNFTYDWLSDLRNKIARECVKRGHDYLFSCDSDILVPRDVLKKLLSHNVDMVAGLIYNGYLFTPPDAEEGYNPLNNAFMFPNILNGNFYTGYKHFVNEDVKNPNLINAKDSLIEVDFTGAVFLATKEACSIGKYEWNIQGEDEPFCRSLKLNGKKIYCDLSCYCQHMMNEEILAMYLNEELKFKNGEVIKL